LPFLIYKFANDPPPLPPFPPAPSPKKEKYKIKDNWTNIRYNPNNVSKLFFLIWIRIRQIRLLRSWFFKGTDESTLG